MEGRHLCKAQVRVLPGAAYSTARGICELVLLWRLSERRGVWLPCCEYRCACSIAKLLSDSTDTTAIDVGNRTYRLVYTSSSVCAVMRFVLSCLAKTGQLERWLGKRRAATDRRGLGTTQDHVAYLSETGDDTCCTQHSADTELMAKRASAAIHGFQAAMLQQPCFGLLRPRI